MKLNKIGSRALRISGASLAVYLTAVEAGTLEALQVAGSAKPAAPKVSSIVEKLRGWSGGT